MLRHARTWLGVLFLMALSANTSASWEVNMTPGVTEVSRSVFNLHMTIFWISVVIGAIVFGVMFWSMFMHRRSRGAVPAKFHENLTVEILWTVIPLLILVGMAIPATKTLIEIYDTEDADIDIMVTGYQWRWQYNYLGEDVSFMSNLATPRNQIANQAAKGEHYLLEVDEPMVVPTGQKVRLLITAADVIHSWWVPALAVKKDAIPGFINEAWTRIDEPGIYRGQCTELCGRDHAFMPIVVDARTPEDYAAWLAEKKAAAAAEAELTSKEWTLEELMERGERVYTSTCVACHQANGEGLPPMFPGLKDSDMVLNDVAAHIDVVVNGVPGTAMAAFGKQLSEVDIAAVVTYERNAWGNDTGEVVAPIDILNFKNGQ
ncbi:cytochrome c oxidase subunit II [Halopseudomonas sp. SMJS2]|uniref:cytochrome c oxidase subunit II n=1 Tax=Halopseudomonas sp. SMJS2 TaxID=3041098 RepID=UPI00044A5044|nr:cytochrome c oxidase subunit II [Halopseudomonas sp. SMJS2]EZQ18004.1 cytochrome B559 subunit alpha [Halopseudomonas bauzanensis]WGK61754.1 cytochrome c oxidase subunit II [Halopseudomonas sp. SMJS2]